jgi:hypothetical protein
LSVTDDGHASRLQALDEARQDGGVARTDDGARADGNDGKTVGVGTIEFALGQ